MDKRVGTSLHTGILIAVIGGFAWVTGLPAIFPSLGPSAFVLAMFPESEASNPQRVIGSHVIGVAAGLFAYHLFAAGLVVTQPVTPLSMTSIRFAASSVSSIMLTVVGMLVFQVRHPPACATTLIVALGVLTSLMDGILIVVSVFLLVITQTVLISIDGLIERIGVVAERP